VLGKCYYILLYFFKVLAVIYMKELESRASDLWFMLIGGFVSFIYHAKFRGVC